jgi:hypothetical protein
MMDGDGAAATLLGTQFDQIKGVTGIAWACPMAKGKPNKRTFLGKAALRAWHAWRSRSFHIGSVSSLD